EALELAGVQGLRTNAPAETTVSPPALPVAAAPTSLPPANSNVEASARTIADLPLPPTPAQPPSTPVGPSSASEGLLVAESSLPLPCLFIPVVAGFTDEGIALRSSELAGPVANVVPASADALQRAMEQFLQQFQAGAPGMPSTDYSVRSFPWLAVMATAV